MDNSKVKVQFVVILNWSRDYFCKDVIAMDKMIQVSGGRLYES
jgi:hypothetical protein